MRSIACFLIVLIFKREESANRKFHYTVQFRKGVVLTSFNVIIYIWNVNRHTTCCKIIQRNLVRGNTQKLRWVISKVIILDKLDNCSSKHVLFILLIIIDTCFSCLIICQLFVDTYLEIIWNSYWIVISMRLFSQNKNSSA